MGKPSKLQDLSLFPGVNDGLKHLQAGAKFYLHGYDKSRGFDKGLVRTEPPADPARLSFIATFYNEGRKLMLRTENARDPADKQRYLLRVGDPTYPFRQFNPEGKDDHADPTRKPWRDQHGDWLFSEATGKLIDPPKTKSFEIQCASCHHTGHSLTPTVSGGFNRRLRERPPWRGRHRGRRRRQRAEPGLRNLPRRRLGALEAKNKAKPSLIVSPGRLAAERATVICTQCHSRPQGTMDNDMPINKTTGCAPPASAATSTW